MKYRGCSILIPAFLCLAYLSPWQRPSSSEPSCTAPPAPPLVPLLLTKRPSSPLHPPNHAGPRDRVTRCYRNACNVGPPLWISLTDRRRRGFVDWGPMLASQHSIGFALIPYIIYFSSTSCEAVPKSDSKSICVRYVHAVSQTFPLWVGTYVVGVFFWHRTSEKIHAWEQCKMYRGPIRGMPETASSIWNPSIWPDFPSVPLGILWTW